MIYELRCQGPCQSHELLATVEYDEEPSPQQLDSLRNAHLCADCGDVYVWVMSQGGHSPGQHPTKEQYKQYHDHGKPAVSQQGG